MVLYASDAAGGASDAMACVSMHWKSATTLTGPVVAPRRHGVVAVAWGAGAPVGPGVVVVDDGAGAAVDYTNFVGSPGWCAAYYAARSVAPAEPKAAAGAAPVAVVPQRAWYHPALLVASVRAGALARVRAIVAALVAREPSDADPPAPPLADMTAEALSPASFSAAACAALREGLARTPLARLTPRESGALDALLATCGALFARDGPEAAAISALDPCGARFLIAARLYACDAHAADVAAAAAARAEGAGGRDDAPPPRPKTYVPGVDVLWALHSDAQDALVPAVVPPARVTWDSLRANGVALWLKSDEELRKCVDAAAKNQYVSASRNPMACMLLYLAQGMQKLPLLTALFKVSTEQKVAGFLKNNFGVDKNRHAAVKNACVLRYVRARVVVPFGPRAQVRAA